MQNAGSREHGTGVSNHGWNDGGLAAENPDGVLNANATQRAKQVQSAWIALLLALLVHSSHFVQQVDGDVGRLPRSLTYSQTH